MRCCIVLRLFVVRSLRRREVRRRVFRLCVSGLRVFSGSVFPGCVAFPAPCFRVAGLFGLRNSVSGGPVLPGGLPISGPSGFYGRMSGRASARAGCRFFSPGCLPPIFLFSLFRYRACSAQACSTSGPVSPSGPPCSLSLVCTLSGNRGRAVFAGFPDRREGLFGLRLPIFRAVGFLRTGVRRGFGQGWLPDFLRAALSRFSFSACSAIGLVPPPSLSTSGPALVSFPGLHPLG